MSLSIDEIQQLVEPARVHSSVYVDEELFQLEMERIWGRSWIYVGHESQVKNPGDYYTTSIGTYPVILIRDAKSKSLHVLHNRCGHRGAIVTQRQCGNAGVLRCPYHGWTYKTDGSIHAIPHVGGYKDTEFDKNDEEFSMKKLPRVEVYRGFVFACLSEDVEDLSDFLGEIADTIDNMCDRSPEGEVEVTGLNCHRFIHPCNWKFFLENLHDAMHPMCAHAGTSDAVRSYLSTMPEGTSPPPEAEIIDPFAGSYDFFDSMGVTGLDKGHGYMGGKKSIFSHYEMYPEYLEAMYSAYGKERTEEILSFNRHNACCYPSSTIRDGIQSIRVLRPVSVDSTIIESWTFRLKGAPEKLLQRTLRYSRLINSPGSMVGPDDLDCYYRIQESAKSKSIEWIDLQRYFGQDIKDDDKDTAPGTSDLAIRNQYKAWLNYMSREA
ncbi:MAG: Rieske 2Fe-2S domain-containing protein [Gammaproteobacteria bacterium]|jgi:benzoate/toluate 1,2-dioxygenase subunit alpha|nr:Rieske 2Fe-2S domain-containing protein [Gammaproteobacteria bacterium]